MNTLWHLFWTYAAFRKKRWWWKAVLFAFIPDALWVAQMLYLLGTHQMTRLNLDIITLIPHVIEIQYALHSTLVFTVLLALVLWWKKESLYGCFWGWGFHIFSDYLTHHGDNYWPLYPLNHWQIQGLISYWEPRYFANEFNLACYGLAALLAWYWICYPSKVNLRDTLFSGICAGFFAVSLVFFPLVHHTPWSLQFIWLPLILYGAVFVRHSQQLKKLFEHIRQCGVLRTVAWLLHH
ncbi:MAG: hypothetical protein AABX70_09125 [Nanoarchaeota archaeon]